MDMHDPNKILPEESKDAVHAARDAAHAVEMAREVQTTRVAEAAANKVSENIGDILQTRIEHVLSRGTEQEKSIILARVPYICQDIKGINAALADIVKMMSQAKRDLDEKDTNTQISNDKKYVNQDQFWPFKWVLITTGTVVITTLAGAVLAQILSR